MKNLFVLNGGAIGTNCYILADENKNCIVFDVPDGCGNQTADFVSSKGLNPAAIFLTHGHFDHCGGVAEFLRRFSVPVYGSEADSDKTENASVNRFGIPAENCEITDFVTDGQRIELKGFDISVLSTPGHSAGSVCYLIDDMIFSGDTLFCGGIGRTDFSDGDFSAMKTSLKKLYDLKGDYKVYPGHERSTTLEHERRSNPYMRF